jgi:primosomal protein N' (replication factor Y) (superfamily II helicase)
VGTDRSRRRSPARRVLDAISHQPHLVAAVLPLVPAWRVDKTFDYVVPAALHDKVVEGSLVRVPFGGRVVRGFVLSLSDVSGTATDGGSLEDIKGVVIRAALAPAPLAAVLGDVARRYVVPRARSFSRMVPPRVRVSPGRSVPRSTALEPDVLSTYEGGLALHAAIRERRAGTWCVQVVPGEDRGRLIAELVSALGSGAGVVLVPEVRYGSLVLDGVARHLPELVRVDSSQEDPDRSAAWLQMAGGHSLAGGGRAAVFTPAADLGLIIIDEEHHQTYKEDRAPRYDARWVAVRRAGEQNAVCVLMSASPSVETGARAADGTYGSVVPARAARRAARPIVELVDRPEDRSIGHELHERMAATLNDGKRVALLAPSPAFARAVWCGGCRRSLRCPRCEAGLFFDRAGARVRCARCGHEEAAPDSCPSCGASDFKLVGAGTERLAEQLRKAFPRVRTRRVDPANPRAGGSEEADIYVTTWMGTKPELRPEVSLVGVLDADWLIRRPDFRSAESAYQAMAEMAEWAGPADAGGRLVIQTVEPMHHSLQAVVRADYDYFLTKELAQRRELTYPPFVELVKVSVEGEGAREAVEEIGEAVRDASERVLGPAEIRHPEGPTSLQLLIKCRDASEIGRSLRVILEGRSKGPRISIDVDPR